MERRKKRENDYRMERERRERMTRERHGLPQEALIGAEGRCP